MNYAFKRFFIYPIGFCWTQNPKVTVANWCLKVNFFLSYKRSAWVGSSGLVWQCHNYWWSKAPFCLPLGSSSALGFHVPSGAAVATSISQSEEGGREERQRDAFSCFHLTGQNLVTCKLLRRMRGLVSWVGPLPPRIESASCFSGRKAIG